MPAADLKYVSLRDLLAAVYTYDVLEDSECVKEPQRVAMKCLTFVQRMALAETANQSQGAPVVAATTAAIEKTLDWLATYSPGSGNESRVAQFRGCKAVDEICKHCNWPATDGCREASDPGSPTAAAAAAPAAAAVSSKAMEITDQPAVSLGTEPSWRFKKGEPVPTIFVEGQNSMGPTEHIFSEVAKLPWHTEANGAQPYDTTKLSGHERMEQQFKTAFESIAPDYKEPRSIQKEVVMAMMLNPQDMVVQLETGGGKTLIFQLIAQLHQEQSRGNAQKKLVVVFGPLTALHKEQANRCDKVGLKSYNLSGLQGALEKKEALEKIINGGDNQTCVLFLCPESLNGSVLKRITRLGKTGRIACVVIDEVHYLCQTDDDFRPQYKMMGEKLMGIRRKCSENRHICPVLAMSGTVGNLVIHEVLQLGKTADSDTCNGLFIPTQTLFFHGNLDDALQNHQITVR